MSCMMARGGQLYLDVSDDSKLGDTIYQLHDLIRRKMHTNAENHNLEFMA